MTSLVDGREDVVVLDVWEELRGRLMRVEEADGYLIVELSGGSVRVPADSMAAECLHRDLEGKEEMVVGIVRTDLPERPYLVAVESGDNNG